MRLLRHSLWVFLTVVVLLLVTSAPRAGGAPTGGSGGPLTDRTNLSFTANGVTSSYHLYAAGLDWSKEVGLLVYTDGSAEYGLKNPGSTYLLAGANGLVNVAKRQNMILLTPLAPGAGCPDGDGTCWYQTSSGITAAAKARWSFDLAQHVKGQYNIETDRVAFGGYSSGAQWTTEFFGPAHASQLMTDGVAVAISYGGQPITTPSFTAAHKANVAYTWDVGANDSAYQGGGQYDAQSGYDWYRTNGFATTQLNVVPSKGHNRGGEFGGIVEREILEHVRAPRSVTPPTTTAPPTTTTPAPTTTAPTTTTTTTAPPPTTTTTPAPQQNPFGSALRLPGGKLWLTGYAIDPDKGTASTQVHFYNETATTFLGWTEANVHRDELAAAFPQYGGAHGYSAVLNVGDAAGTVCGYAINYPTGQGLPNPQIGCHTYPAAPVVPAPTPTPTPTATTTTTTTPPPAAGTTATVNAVAGPGSGEATLNWQLNVGTDGANGAILSRDGTDTDGDGPWATDPQPGTSGSWTFRLLVPGQTYQLKAQPTRNGTPVGTPASVPYTAPGGTPAPTTTTPAPTTTTPPPAAGDWLSGAGLQSAIGPFEAWRGSPVEIGATWPNTPANWETAPGEKWAGFPGAMSVNADPGASWPGSYGAVASGAMDGWFTDFARTLKGHRAHTSAPTFVTPFYEFNGEWMAYSVQRTTQGMADFKAAFERVAGIIKREFPAAKVYLPATCNRDVPAAMIPAASTYDGQACTVYNAYVSDPQGGTVIGWLDAAKARAAAHGKPLGITEWSDSGNPNTEGGNGDTPAFMTAMRDWMTRNAGTGPGQLVFETVFDIGGYSVDYRLSAGTDPLTNSPSQPQTAQRYRDLW